MSASALALARYVHPGDRDADDTLNKILGILDHTDIVAALQNKMDLMLGSPSRGIARRDAPSGQAVKQLDLCADPDDPSNSLP